MVRDFTFFRPSRILPTDRIFPRGLPQRSVPDSPDRHHSLRETPCLLLMGGLEPSNLGIGNERNPLSTNPTIQIWVFICRVSSEK